MLLLVHLCLLILLVWLPVMASGGDLISGSIQPFGCLSSYEEARPSNGLPATGEVLLLHGVRYSSSTWADLGTLDMLASKGFRVVALDLPGYGKSSDPRVDHETDADFMMECITLLKMRRPVIVTPSMSGTKFGISLAVEYPASLGGWVPIAPGAASRIFPEVYESLELHTLVVWGQNDRMGAQSSKALLAIPGAEKLMIPDAGHACYLEDTELFHTALVAFALDCAKGDRETPKPGGLRELFVFSEKAVVRTEPGRREIEF
mmetsp:Transcript_74908/g.150617  ORF Transcript_74908/g.150617 Transcript_74908/m.150617 type:complete len:262 (+) Transcript_74908:118-903(+)